MNSLFLEKSGKPMVDILNTKEFSTGLLCRFLKEDESFSQIEKKEIDYT